MTEHLHFHFLLSCIGEGNGNPLQCSCLENPRDGGALWAAMYGVSQSRTRLTRLSSSSSSFFIYWVLGSLKQLMKKSSQLVGIRIQTCLKNMDSLSPRLIQYCNWFTANLLPQNDQYIIYVWGYAKHYIPTLCVYVYVYVCVCVWATPTQKACCYLELCLGNNK